MKCLTLNEAYTDYLGGHDLLCTRYKITAAAAKAVQKRTTLGGGRDHDRDRSLSTDGRIQHGGERQGRGVGRGAGRAKGRDGQSRVYFHPKETRTCFKCNGQGHLAEVCLSLLGKLRAKLSQHTSVTHRLRPKHVFVLCDKNSLRLTGGYSATNGITTPEVCVLTDISFNKFRQRAEEFGVGGITMCLPTAPT